MDTPQSLPSEQNTTNPTSPLHNTPTTGGPTPSINSTLTSDPGHGRPRAGSVVRGDGGSTSVSRPSTSGVSRPSTATHTPGTPTSPRSRHQQLLSIDAARVSPTLSNFQQPVSSSSTH